MSDSSAPFWPGSRDLEAVVSRAVAARVDPLQAQLDSVARALAILAERMPDPSPVGEVTSQVAALAARLEEMAPVGPGLDDLRRALVASRAEAEELRRTMTAALEHAVVGLGAALSTEGARILDQVGAARAADAATLGRSLAEIEAARTTDATRVLDRLEEFEAPVARDALARQAQFDDLRSSVVTRIDKAVSRIDAGRTADADRIVDRITALADRTEADARRSQEQATALLAALDARLQSLHDAGVAADGTSEGRLGSRLEAITAEHREVLLARIDERTAAIKDLEAIAPRLGAEVQAATATALTAKVGPLVTRLVDAIDALAHEGGRIEALAKGHAGESHAVEARIAALFAEVAERSESAVDRSRGRIAEGQVALGAKFESIMTGLLTAVDAATDRLEGRLVESAEGLRTTGGHQNGALLDAVNRSSQQLSDGLGEVRSYLVAAGTERRADVLAGQLDTLRAAVESIRHDPRLEALVVEQVAAREAQMAAIDAVAGRVNEVGPIVARALLPEVERAVRAANAAEETVAGLRPDALRAAVAEGSGQAAADIHAAARRLDQTIAVIAYQVDQGLTALAESQAGIRAELARLPQTSGAASARIDQLDGSLGAALADLASSVAASRAELLSLTTRALDRAATVADDVAQASGTAVEDLRASQDTLREAVQDGAHKAELAAVDIRGLRERITPHLVALAEATTRRAEADQAGFDAVLTRLDQLLAARQP